MGGFFLGGGGGIQGKSCFHIQRFHSQFAGPRDSYPIFLFKKTQIAVYILALFIANKLQVPITSVG